MWILRKLLERFFGTRTTENDITGIIAGNSAWLFVMHCAALTFGFILNYLVVLMAGVENFGGYIYIFNLIYLLVSISNLGMDTLVLSNVDTYHSTNQFNKLKGLLIFSLFAVLVGALLTSIITSILPPIRMVTEQKASANWIIISIPALILLSVTAINQASLQGLGKVIHSQLIEKIIKPLLLLILVPVYYFAAGTLSVQRLISINILVIAICAGISLIFNLKQIGKKIKHTIPVFDKDKWIPAAWGFFLASILYMLNARVDIFMLGLFRNNSEIGIYSIALRVSEVSGFALSIINFVLAPLIVKFHIKGQELKLQTIITTAARFVLLVSLPFIIAIVFFSERILLIFGEEFLAAEDALLILASGQLVNVLLGSVGLILLMTRNQKYSIISLIGGTAINIILNLILAPVYGVTGTAIASSASMIFWNCLMYYFVRRNTNIRTTAFGSF